jgi:hypothetical protein
MSDHGNLIVARHLDGTIVRGTTRDFQPGRNQFRVKTEEATELVRVDANDLKAVFYVKSLFGDHTHEETKSFKFKHGVGRKIWVKFRDGEEISGWTVGYTPAKPGFFIFLTDEKANAERAYVLNHAVEEVLLDAEAEAAAEEYANLQTEDTSARRIQSDQWKKMLGIETPSPEPAPSAGRPPRKKRGSGIFLGDW